MTDTIAIRGKDYQVNNFGSLQLAPILSLLSNITQLHLNLEQQFEVGFLFKEVIFQDLPEDIVKVTSNGSCVLLLDVDELSDVATQLSTLHAKRGAKKSRESGDIDRAEKFERTQHKLETGEMTSEEEKAALAEITRLTNMISSKKMKI